jgi:hypothetical protein
VNMGLSPPGYNAWIKEKVKHKERLILKWKYATTLYFIFTLFAL